jgi:hypothetical protein
MLLFSGVKLYQQRLHWTLAGATMWTITTRLGIQHGHMRLNLRLESRMMSERLAHLCIMTYKLELEAKLERWSHFYRSWRIAATSSLLSDWFCIFSSHFVSTTSFPLSLVSSHYRFGSSSAYHSPNDAVFPPSSPPCWN